jgi:DNA-binding PadR family transcriptional regulator
MRGSRMRHMHEHRSPHRGRSGHRARRGAIKGSVLRLLAERPMHGYELITEFEERSGGRWRPSPGSVYPLLTQLEAEGLIRTTDDGGRRQFELTDEGRAWLDEHQSDTALPWERWTPGGRGDLRRLGGEILGQLRQLGRYGSPAQWDKAAEILGRTRQELYELLATPPTDEQP